MSQLMDTLKSKPYLIYFLSACSGIYILKSSYNFISNYFKEKNTKKEILKIIDNYRQLIDNNRHLSKHEQCFLMYYVILNSLYKKELTEYDENRRKNINDLELYIQIVEKSSKVIKSIEENILQIVFNEFQEDGEHSDNENHVNTKEIKKVYYKNLDKKITVTSKNLIEIVEILHQKTRVYMAEFMDHMSNKNEEKIQMIAEYRSFDYIFLNYGFDRDEIEKAIIEHEIIIEEK